MLVANLASEAGIDAVAARAAAAPLDLVINNAGMGGYRRFVELNPKVADALIAIHIRAVVRVTLAALPGMVERKRGGVINVSSLLAFSGASTDAFLPKRVVYAGAKAFLVTFTQALANELTDTGVRVQVCLPGVIKTEFHEVQGMDMSKMPRMSPDDLARASLAGLRLGEVVCVPALEDAAAAQRIDEANRTLLEVARSTTIAARYRSVVAHRRTGLTFQVISPLCSLDVVDASSPSKRARALHRWSDGQGAREPRPSSRSRCSFRGSASCTGVAKNIGPGGVFVATVRMLGVGARVTVTIKLQGDAAPIEALAQVRWCRPFLELDNQPAGVGLQFIDTPLRATILTNELRRSRDDGAA